MPPQDTGMSADDAIKLLRGRPADKQKAILARLNPEVKQKVLTQLQSPPKSESKPLTEQQKYDLGGSVFATPEQRHVHKIDHLIDEIPTAVSTAISLPEGSKATAPGLAIAGFGGAVGENVRELAGEMFYNDPARRAALPINVHGSLADREKAWAKQTASGAAEQGLAELGSRVTGGAFGKIMEKTGLRAAANSQVAAGAEKPVLKSAYNKIAEKIGLPLADIPRPVEPSGVQLTPGEAGGKRFIQGMEHYMGAFPGAMQKMAEFEGSRAAQTTAELTKRLNAIDPRGKSKEAIGVEVKNVVQQMHEQATQIANDAYNPLKAKMGLPVTATKEEMEAAAKKAALPGKHTNFGWSGPRQGDGGTALRELVEADKKYVASRENIERDLVSTIANSNRVEAAHAFVSAASLDDIRHLLPKLPAETRQGLARNVVADAIEGATSPSGEFSAKAALARLKEMNRDGDKSGLLLGKNKTAIEDSLRQIEKIQHTTPFKNMRIAHRALGMSEAVAAIALGAQGHPVAATMGLASAMGGSRFLAYLVTNPQSAVKTLTALRKVAQGAIRVGVPGATDYVSQDALEAPAMPISSEHPLYSIAAPTR